MSDTLLLAALLIPSLVIAIVFHEVAHGWVALMLGDRTAYVLGRLTLNPLRHVDPVGTLVVPGLLALTGGPVFGWAKPVPVVKERLHNPRFGMMAVAAAGPGTNFVLALIGALALGLALPDGAQDAATATGMPLVAGADGEIAYLASGLFFFVLINLFLGIFNLLPIPPFDGSHILEGLLPRGLAAQYERLRPFGMVLFFGLIAVTWLVPEWNVIGRTIGAPVSWAMGMMLGLAGAVAQV